jgi:XTP/dITP diphosphohydrolase
MTGKSISRPSSFTSHGTANANVNNRRLILGTANFGKARELTKLLDCIDIQLFTLADFDDPCHVDESGRSIAENACLKATVQAAHLNAWVLGDDTALEVDALGGAPGVRTARFAGPDADAAANRLRLLEALAGIPVEGRTARFVCHLALADPSGAVRAESQAHCRGRIGLNEVGEGGFGYDSLFQVVEYHRTFAELGDAAKNRLGHRGRAVEKMIPQIQKLIDNGAMDR